MCSVLDIVIRSFSFLEMQVNLNEYMHVMRNLKEFMVAISRIDVVHFKRQLEFEVLVYYSIHHIKYIVTGYFNRQY
jgi:hypothetical protein